MTTSTIAATTDGAVASNKAIPRIMYEYLNENPLSKFMRPDADAVIQIDPFVSSTITVNGGLKFVSTFRPRLSDAAVEGENSVIEGTEEDLSIYNDTLIAEKVAKGVKVQNFIESQRRTVANLKAESKNALKEWLSNHLYRKVITALKDTTGRTQARTLYGKTDSNWNATEATARGNVDGTNDRLTGAIIDLLVSKSQNQGNQAIRPANVSQKKGVVVQNFQLLIPDAVWTDLQTDTQFREKVNNVTRDEGRIAHAGCQYKGTYNGVDIHVLYDQNLYARGEGAASIDIGICFFLGAQAVKVGYAERARIAASDSTDYKTQHKEAIIEYRGQKKNVFNGEDFSVITAYVACDAPAAV